MSSLPLLASISAARSASLAGPEWAFTFGFRDGVFDEIGLLLFVLAAAVAFWRGQLSLALLAVIGAGLESAASRDSAWLWGGCGILVLLSLIASRPSLGRACRLWLSLAVLLAVAALSLQWVYGPWSPREAVLEEALEAAVAACWAVACLVARPIGAPAATRSLELG